MSKEIITQAYNAWSRCADIRNRRQRCKRYTYGDQWGDIVRDNLGKLHVESELIRTSGNRPVINNLIRQLVKTIIGRFRAEQTENGAYTATGLRAVAESNALPEIDSRMFEEFLISGCAVQRIAADGACGRSGLCVHNVDFRKFFVNAFSDPRGWDINLIGQLHDMTFPELASRFARGSRARAEVLRELYAGKAAPDEVGNTIGGAGADVDFFTPHAAGQCRVAEVWTLDATGRRKGDSLNYSFRWHCRWLTPDGTLLQEYDSPFAHGSHPYAVKFYPLTDGEVHSFVEDILDQQKGINRMLVLIDRMIASSAKGVLLFPCDQLVEGMTWADVCRRWAQADGVIPVTGRGEHLPQQVMNNPGDTGAYQYLQLQMKLFDNISGVSESLTGHASASAQGAELYESQVRNATIALGDIFETFGAFLAGRNAKILATKA